MKKKLKKNEKWTIGTILFLIVGTALFLIGAKLSGWDIWSWFTTPTAYLIYALIGVALLGIAYLFIIRRIKNDE